MKKIFKKATAVILTLVMMLTAAPLSGFVGLDFSWLTDLFSIKASAETTTYSGTCGDNLTWTLDTKTGVLEISGTGDMYDWTKYDERPEWFNYRAYVESVNIEVGVVSIGHYAFRLFNNLKNVLIPDSVTYIGIGAFYECGSLENLTIPNGVVDVGSYAIAYCYRLSEVTFGKNVKDIGEFALFCCENLSKISVNLANNYYSSDSFGVLFNKDKTELIQYPNGNTRTSYAIPNTVIQINDHAFLSSSNLITITIPDSVEFLGYRAFDSCESVLDIVIPDSVTEIEDSAFRLCDNLKNVTLSNSLEYIADSVFSGCVSLKSIEIPNSVLDIKDGAFSGCSSLETVEIPDNVKSIGMAAFRNCTNLRNIILPVGLERIGSDAFAYTAFYNDKNNWDGSALYISNYLINKFFSLISSLRNSIN
ncbi:MAG: leucine-rich repeat domain-containing protein [Clostridia bacterium]|nr:leucine-rich repeat domain-containing protein [Clostridia bacterium]